MIRNNAGRLGEHVAAAVLGRFTPAAGGLTVYSQETRSICPVGTGLLTSMPLGQALRVATPNSPVMAALTRPRATARLVGHDWQFG